MGIVSTVKHNISFVAVIKSGYVNIEIHAAFGALENVDKVRAISKRVLDM